MDDIWPLIVGFLCVFAFSLLMLVLNINIRHNGFAKKLSYYLLWAAALGATGQLIYILFRLSQVD